MGPEGFYFVYLTDTHRVGGTRQHTVWASPMSELQYRPWPLSGAGALGFLKTTVGSVWSFNYLHFYS